MHAHYDHDSALTDRLFELFAIPRRVGPIACTLEKVNAAHATHSHPCRPRAMLFAGYARGIEWYSTILLNTYE